MKRNTDFGVQGPVENLCVLVRTWYTYWVKQNGILSSYRSILENRVKFLEEFGLLLLDFTKSPSGNGFELYQDGEIHLENDETVVLTVKAPNSEDELSVSVDRSSLISIEVNEEREHIDLVQARSVDFAGAQALTTIFHLDFDSELAQRLKTYVNGEIGVPPTPEVAGPSSRIEPN